MRALLLISMVLGCSGVEFTDSPFTSHVGAAGAPDVLSHGGAPESPGAGGVGGEPDENGGSPAEGGEGGQPWAAAGGEGGAGEGGAGSGRCVERSCDCEGLPVGITSQTCTDAQETELRQHCGNLFQCSAGAWHSLGLCLVIVSCP